MFVLLHHDNINALLACSGLSSISKPPTAVPFESQSHGVTEVSSSPHYHHQYIPSYSSPVLATPESLRKYDYSRAQQRLSSSQPIRAPACPYPMPMPVAPAPFLAQQVSSPAPFIEPQRSSWISKVS